MKTHSCAAATDSRIVLVGAETQKALHEKCPGFYRQAPTMVIEHCTCSCHAGLPPGEHIIPADLPIMEAISTEAPEASAQDRKKPRKRSTGTCEHCGGPTGGRFMPGHDAKLKSELLGGARRHERSDDWLELLIRDWARIPDSVKPDRSVIDQAVARWDAMGPKERVAWLEARNRSRAKRFNPTT